MHYNWLLPLFFLSLLPGCWESDDSFASKVVPAAQMQTLKTSALRDAKATSTAGLTKDWKTVLRHTHPNIIKAMGGPEAAEPMLASMMDAAEDFGISIDALTIEKVSEIVNEQGQYRCLVTNRTTMTIMGQTEIHLSSFLGVYDPKKEIWYFVEADQLLVKEVQEMLFPNFQTSIQIPEDKEL